MAHQKLDIYALQEIISKFIYNDKIANAVVDKFKLYLNYNIDKKNDIASYHWDLSNVQLGNNQYIGYMPNSYYYSNMIKLDLNTYSIVDIPNNVKCLYREQNQEHALKILKQRVILATAILDKFRG